MVRRRWSNFESDMGKPNLAWDNVLAWRMRRQLLDRPGNKMSLRIAEK
jgi:hypothetical protein